MAYEYPEFRRDFIAAWSVPEDCWRAFKYYVHGLKQGPNHGLTIGLVEFLKGDVAAHGSVFGTDASAPIAHDRSGKIFTTPMDGAWKIYFNDAFILGGIHSHGRFELAAVTEWEPWVKQKVKDPVDGQNQLDIWNPHASADFPMRVTQREVFALNIFGFEGMSGLNGNGRREFKCKDPGRASKATLVEYKNAVEAFVGAMS